MSDSLIIIPTYNEKENIVRLLETVMALEGDYHVLVVDDSSPDGTAALVREVMEKYSGRIHLLVRPAKSGLGTAYIAGFKWGLERTYELLFEMDADFSHNPADLVRLAEPIRTGKADLVVGSRYVKGGKLENWPLDRILLSRGASMYVRMITWMPVKDPTAGFVCYHRRVLEALDLDAIRFVGYAFQIEMKFCSWKKGFRIAEVPILFADRRFGTSKMSTAIVKEAILGVWYMQGKALMGAHAN